MQSNGKNIPTHDTIYNPEEEEQQEQNKGLLFNLKHNFLGVLFFYHHVWSGSGVGA